MPTTGTEWSHRRALSVIAILAGALALAGLVVGLAGAGFDVEAVSDPESFAALGTGAVAPVRWGTWLSMFGNYLLLVPIALHLLRWLRDDDPFVADVSTAAAGFYLLLGAAGGGVLAATQPELIQQYATADAATRPGLLADLDLVRRIGEDGLQGVAQNVAGATWFLGMGSLLRRHRPVLGGLAIAIGAALVLSVVGIVVDVEVLRLLGLTGTLLLVPAWAIGLGRSLWRAP